jgi:N-acetylglucosaminyldiphosphoundecaprenol N-acetyl-beta-D-mannosaminyltransferase
MRQFEVLGVRVDIVDVQGLHKFIKRTIQSRGHEIVSNVNVQALNLGYKQPWLRDFFNQSGIVFCDGAGVQLGAIILGKNVPIRVTYADWMWELCRFVEAEGFSLFFLGAEENIANEAARRLIERYPGLDIRGCCHGYFDKSHDSSENNEVLDQINSSRANILIVGFGMPLQEKWLKENWSDLKVNIALTGGAVFDYVSGKLQRGNRLLTDHGLEWLARLLIEPRRRRRR